MLCMAAIYAILFTFAMLVTVGSPSPPGDKQKADQLTKRLYGAFSFLYNDAARDLNFYLLWLTRFLYLTVGAAVLAHWKTFSFTQSENDQLVSIVGSLRFDQSYTFKFIVMPFLVEWLTLSPACWPVFFLICWDSGNSCLFVASFSQSTLFQYTSLGRTSLASCSVFGLYISLHLAISQRFQLRSGLFRMFCNDKILHYRPMFSFLVHSPML